MSENVPAQFPNQRITSRCYTKLDKQAHVSILSSVMRDRFVLPEGSQPGNGGDSALARGMTSVAEVVSGKEWVSGARQRAHPSNGVLDLDVAKHTREQVGFRLAHAVWLIR
ncbi:MAG: hypothetical protein ACRDHE_09520 [Ktedonobacterales bacterium]